MKKTTALLFTALLSACGGGNAARPKPVAVSAPEPVHYTYVVKAVHPHLQTSYTQGLQYADGILWEGTGEYGHSLLQKTDLETGKAEVVARLPRDEFGEGIALLGDKIYQLTWQDNKAYVYDRATGRQTGTFTYPGEGWGLTTDGSKLYLSDGTSNIYTLDPATFKREKRTTVTLKGEPVFYLNELEWIGGKIWANIYTPEQIYTSEQIAIIDPQTGFVEGVVDLTGLLPEADRTPRTDVLNGIAYDPATGRIFVTGKCWNKLFEIEIVKK